MCDSALLCSSERTNTGDESGDLQEEKKMLYTREALVMSSESEHNGDVACA